MTFRSAVLALGILLAAPSPAFAQVAMTLDQETVHRISDGSVNIKLDFLPASMETTLQIRDPRPADDDDRE